MVYEVIARAPASTCVSSTLNRSCRRTRVGELLTMWTQVLILLLYATYGQTEFEGSATDSGDTIGERFVEFGQDEEIITDSTRPCVTQQFPGQQGFRLKQHQFDHIFICANGYIGVRNGFYQNWPYNFGSRIEHESDVAFAPFWSRVDLTAFDTGESSVRFRSYHEDVNRVEAVFDKVNSDIRGFTGRDSFSAIWISVVTYIDIRPHNRAVRNFQGKNNFQVVFASDETSWYFMYNYADIDWAVGVPRAEYENYVQAAGHPVVGWNAGRNGFDYNSGEQYENLLFSGTVNVEDIDDYEGNLGVGRWIFEASPQDLVKSESLLCYEWYVRAQSISPGLRWQCPPSIMLARLDFRFFRSFDFTFFGYPCYTRIFPINGPGLRCCYERGFHGALLTSPLLPGGFLSANPLFFGVNEDDNAYLDCCVFSQHCNRYIQRRPKQNGLLYRLLRIAWALGDPHYSTLDRMNYTFNGCGDYMFVTSIDNSFQIQVKFSRVVGAGLGTVIFAVLLKEEGFPAIQVTHNKNGNPPMLLHINGTEFTDYNSLSTQPHFVGSGIMISKTDDNVLAISTHVGHAIEVTREPDNLVVSVVLDDSLFGMTRGLLGNWNGMMEDDFVLPNGTSLGFPLTDEQIHFDFGESWRLAPEQNFFVNTSADVAFFCPDDYMPIFVSNFTFPNDSFRTTAEGVCNGNINCLFDTAATLMPSFGETTMNSLNTIETMVSIAENNVPTFENSNVVFNLTLGEEFVYTLRANDADGDPVEFSTTDLPAGATIERNGNEITFRWVVNTIQAFNLTFIVSDNKNGSSSLLPLINICACQNNGQCVRQDSNVILAHDVLSCECAVGFIGDFCQDVRDFCQTQAGSPCHPLSTCTNFPTNFTCGGCPSGYSGTGEECVDIDECIDNTDNCEMVCVNNAGSFFCQCMDGYRLNDDMKTCSDIDECEVAHDCQQNCNNTDGSFVCFCGENFIVDQSNPQNCLPRTACPPGNPCQQVCAIDSVTAEEICSCNRGYMVDPNDATKCIDLDECSSTNLQLCSQQCVNTAGSFECLCSDGYTLLADGFTCQDINECVIPLSSACNTSDGGEVCVNLPGTFRCECNRNVGFVRVNGICQVAGNNEVFEEADDPPPASSEDRSSSVQLRLSGFQNEQYDRNTDIAYRNSIAAALNSYCNLNSARLVECGLPGRGFQFSELLVFREPNATRQNGDDLLVSFYAIYPNGAQAGSRVPVPRSVLLSALTDKLSVIQASTGVTTLIEDVDECQDTNRCNQFCENTPGSFVCTCRPGYRLQDDKSTCVDVDECAEQIDNCDGFGEICANILNDFVCECNRTLDLGRINGTCQVLNGTEEPPPVPRNATPGQISSAVDLHIHDFSTDQFGGQTDSQLREEIANALNVYCHVNAARRQECVLPAAGFQFSPQDIHRLPSHPVQNGDDTLVSYYALYPDGAQNGTNVPVSQQILTRAITEGLEDIRARTGLNSLSLEEDDEETVDDEVFDWPLALAIGLVGALMLVLAIILLLCCCCRGHHGVEKRRPLRYIYDAYRHAARRRLNIADLEPSFGTFHSMSGETYSGFDEDGLPVEIQTGYDGLSQHARSVAHSSMAGHRAQPSPSIR